MNAPFKNYVVFKWYICSKQAIHLIQTILYFMIKSGYTHIYKQISNKYK